MYIEINIMIIYLIIIFVLILVFLNRKEGFEVITYNNKLFNLPKDHISYIPSRRQIDIYSNLPKIIFTFWDKGWDKAPYICQKCIQSWEYYNPEYKIIKLDKTIVYDYLDKNFLDELWYKNNIQTQSDIIRSNLLSKYGGIWVDSTLFCTRPLYLWLPNYLEIGFFTFSYRTQVNKVDKGIILPENLKKTDLNKKNSNPCKISNFFIVSTLNNYIMKTFTESYNLYWKNRYQSDKYFNFHFVFCQLYHENKLFQHVFNDMPVFDSDIVRLGNITEILNSEPFNLVKKPSHSVINYINNPNIPMLKLSHQYIAKKYRNGKSLEIAKDILEYLENKSQESGSLLRFIIDKHIGI